MKSHLTSMAWSVQPRHCLTAVQFALGNGSTHYRTLQVMLSSTATKKHNSVTSSMLYLYI
jgi:hypothetical protein